MAFASMRAPLNSPTLSDGAFWMVSFDTLQTDPGFLTMDGDSSDEGEGTQHAYTQLLPPPLVLYEAAWQKRAHIPASLQARS
jgi:hypothetical protein